MNKIENGSNLPVVFTFGEKNKVRIVNNNHPWFVAIDICNSLGLKNPSVTVQQLDDDERAKFNLGRQGETWFVNESGLYNLIFRSNKPEAKEFRRWVTGVVLPELRRTGSYGAGASTALSDRAMVRVPDQALLDLVGRATMIIGSANKLAARIGISGGMITFLRTNPEWVSSEMMARIETVCNNIVNNGDKVDRTTVDMLMQIDDHKIRLGLWQKLQEGGAA